MPNANEIPTEAGRYTEEPDSDPVDAEGARRALSHPADGDDVVEGPDGTMHKVFEGQNIPPDIATHLALQKEGGGDDQTKGALAKATESKAMKSSKK